MLQHIQGYLMNISPMNKQGSAAPYLLTPQKSNTDASHSSGPHTSSHSLGVSYLLGSILGLLLFSTPLPLLLGSLICCFCSKYSLYSNNCQCSFLVQSTSLTDVKIQLPNGHFHQTFMNTSNSTHPILNSLFYP